ncbi:MAG: hypothetical protein QM731_04515 [Chitinophagaceae bacterium]
MAIVFEGLSKCPLCNEVLDKENEFMLVPPVISNTKDELFLFSDAGIHVECLDRSENRNKLLYHIQQYHELLSRAKLKSIADGEQAGDGRDMLLIGLLSSNEKEELSEFNYTVLNLNKLKQWEDYDRFIDVAGKFLSEGKWGGYAGYNYLEKIMQQIAIRRK